MATRGKYTVSSGKLTEADCGSARDIDAKIQKPSRPHRKFIMENVNALGGKNAAVSYRYYYIYITLTRTLKNPAADGAGLR